MKRKSLHDDSNRKKRRQRCRQRCGHCQQFLSNSQFHEHRRLYFNSSLNQWKTVEHIRKSSVAEDVPGSSSSESEDENVDSSPKPAVQDIPASDSDAYSGSESYSADYQVASSRLCPYARIIASWCGNNGVINPGIMRAGIIRYFMVHSVEIKGKQTIHTFAVVNWLKSSEQDLGFGNPLSVWLPNNIEHGGPAVFLPVQRIHSKFLFVDKLYSGQRYLICSPICRRILL